LTCQPSSHSNPVLAIAILPDYSNLLTGSDVEPGRECRYLDETENLSEEFWGNM
jgi:hypothetical protein